MSEIVRAKQKGIAKRLLIEAALDQEIQTSAPLSKTIYDRLRAGVLEVLQEVSLYDASARVVLDHPFHHRLIGATNLLQVSVGPPSRNIQVRIKVKIVPRSETPEFNESNRLFWRKHIPDDAICFTFALEGGVPQAENANYYDCRWITIRRDGSMCMHPLDGDLGTNYGNNDLGGSAKGPGSVCSAEGIREYVSSVLTNSHFWEFVAAGE